MRESLKGYFVSILKGGNRLGQNEIVWKMGKLNDIRKFVEETRAMINERIEEIGMREAMKEINSSSGLELSRRARVSFHYKDILEKVRIQMIQDAHQK